MPNIKKEYSIFKNNFYSLNFGFNKKFYIVRPIDKAVYWRIEEVLYFLLGERTSFIYLFIYFNTISQIDIIYSILAAFFHPGALDYCLNGLMIEPLLGEGLEDVGMEELDVG